MRSASRNWFPKGTNVLIFFILAWTSCWLNRRVPNGLKHDDAYLKSQWWRRTLKPCNRLTYIVTLLHWLSKRSLGMYMRNRKNCTGIAENIHGTLIAGFALSHIVPSHKGVRKMPVWVIITQYPVLYAHGFVVRFGVVMALSLNDSCDVFTHILKSCPSA